MIDAADLYLGLMVLVFMTAGMLTAIVIRILFARISTAVHGTGFGGR